MNSSLQLIYVLFMRDLLADYNPGIYISRNRFTNHPSAGEVFLTGGVLYRGMEALDSLHH